MKLGNFAAWFYESDSESYFYLKSDRLCLFFAIPMLHHTPRGPTCVGNLPSGKTIVLIDMGDTQPVYSNWV